MVDQGTTEIVRRDVGPGSAALARPSEDWDLGIPVERLVARVEKIKEVQSKVMKADHHYGVIPGTGGKPTLLKPGAEILCLAFQLAPEFSTVETRDGDHLECVVTCKLTHAPTGTLVGEGIGSCSTRESKYAYRSAKRKCPVCGSDAALNKSKRDPGFYCWDKKAGCGATFPANDKRITEQVVGRITNPDLPDVYNTVRKMACKRAHVAAVLFVTCASEIFTQDVEDMNGGGNHDDAGGYGGYDDAPAANQQASRTQQSRRSANGDRPDDNRGRSNGGSSSRGAQQQSSASSQSSEDFQKLLGLIKGTTTIPALEELVPELQIARDEQSVALEEYKLLREAYSARAAELKGQTRASA